MKRPITPAQVAKKVKIPDVVIEVINNLIEENWNGKGATVMQKQAAAQIAQKMEIPVQKVYDNHYLDIEEIYTKAGWSVEYSKPAFCDEPFEAHFKFSPRT